MLRRTKIALVFGLVPCLFGCPGDDGSPAADTGMTPTGGATGDATAGDDDDDGDGDGDGGTVTPATDDGTADDTGGGPGGPPAAVCEYRCGSDADCTIGGVDYGFTCDNGTCSGSVCTSDDKCTALQSGWTQPCTAGGGECEAAGQVCVEVDGAGVCAISAAIQNCMALGAQEAKVVDIDGASAVVCVRPAVCGTDGQCFEPCASDMSCLGAGFPHCNTETGRCECTEDADCQLSPLPQHAVCIEGKCGCSTDAQCFDGKVGDVCSGGVCGCSDDVACSEVTQQYDGGSVTCVMQ